MRVVLLSTFHEQCGIAAYSEALADALARAGASVDVLSPYRQRGDAGWGTQPPRLWHRNRAFGVEAFRVFRAVRARRPDIVHAQVNLSLFSSRLLYAIGALLRRADIPFVATLHGRPGGSWGRDFKLWRFAQGLRHADLIVHNDAHRRELARDRVHVVPHGIPKRTPRSKHEARRALGLRADGPVLAHFGFLVPDKGIAEMLHAITALARGPFPDIYYWIAGAVYRSPESRACFRALRQMAADLGIADRVHLAGEFLPEEQAFAQLEAADWIVLNYRSGNSQGASGAARLALAAGRPVAVSAAAVFDDVREATATVGEPLPESLAALLADRDAARAIAERGRAFCDEHSWENVAARHVALYESISRKRSAHDVIADRADGQHQR